MHLCKQLVESGAAIFASTISDVETAADKCEEMEEGYLQCSQFLYGAGGPCAGLGAEGGVLGSHKLLMPEPGHLKGQGQLRLLGEALQATGPHRAHTRVVGRLEGHPGVPLAACGSLIRDCSPRAQATVTQQPGLGLPQLSPLLLSGLRCAGEAGRHEQRCSLRPVGL